jgi:hypothetical protein
MSGSVFVIVRGCMVAVRGALFLVLQVTLYILLSLHEA